MEKLEINKFFEIEGIMNSFYKKGELDKVENYLNSIIKNSKKEYLEVYLFLADHYLFTEDYDKLNTLSNYLIDLNIGSGYYYKGSMLLNKNKIKESIVFLEKANELETNNPLIIRELGYANGLLGNFDKSLFLLSRSYQIAKYLKIGEDVLEKIEIDYNEISKMKKNVTI